MLLFLCTFLIQIQEHHTLFFLPHRLFFLPHWSLFSYSSSSTQILALENPKLCLSISFFFIYIYFPSDFIQDPYFVYYLYANKSYIFFEDSLICICDFDLCSGLISNHLFNISLSMSNRHLKSAFLKWNSWSLSSSTLFLLPLQAQLTSNLPSSYSGQKTWNHLLTFPFLTSTYSFLGNPIDFFFKVFP